MTTWKELKKELTIDNETRSAIELEEGLLRTLIRIREEKGLTQAQLAEMCNMAQPAIARLESSAHSPKIDSLLRILTPMGYTLKIVPLEEKE